MNKVQHTKRQRRDKKSTRTQKKFILIGAVFVICALVLKRDAH